jgi:hypothetical protein
MWLSKTTECFLQGIIEGLHIVNTMIFLKAIARGIILEPLNPSLQKEELIRSFVLNFFHVLHGKLDYPLPLRS